MDPVEEMSSYVAFIRALYLIHQRAHWKCKGNNFYGNHLLFQRLYEGTQASADEAAEKTIGLFGELEDKTDSITKIVADYSGDDLIQNSIEAEEEFQVISKRVYNKFKDSEYITLGLDDMLMALASKHEVHIYLLKQSHASS